MNVLKISVSKVRFDVPGAGIRGTFDVGAVFTNEIFLPLYSASYFVIGTYHITYERRYDG